ncbi:hypothetical protein [Nocardia cyriacigeorgica]|uniref:Uncharacterized protein n=1 Tax=Nocardia cyriacigeorgica TaxID=135487 RepID=A0A4U8W9Q4_9NOCA|nr:hypothetical protein [Nocardia cyriacigeorgica]VFB01485.1 Uncharacterised protein [Nocardia cyriacigeorgica]
MPDIRELTVKLNEALGIETPAATELEPWQELVTPEEFERRRAELRECAKVVSVEVTGDYLMRAHIEVGCPDVLAIGDCGEGFGFPAGHIWGTGILMPLVDRITAHHGIVYSVRVSFDEHEADFEFTFPGSDPKEARKLIKSSAAELMKEWAAAELSRYVVG